MNRHFFDTIQTTPDLFTVYNEQAKTQSDMVLECFHVNGRMAWFEVHAMIPDMNEISLKRSLSNLQERGLIVKDTDKSNMVLSHFGKPCHRYYLVKK